MDTAANTDIKVQDIEYPSTDGKSTIHGIIWQPQNISPVGVVQLIHGMSEHIARYDKFARFLTQKGFVVCGHDHIGHGKSVSDKDDLGHMPIKNGADVLVADVETLRQSIAPLFPDIPYFIFGHSMGSYTLRVYLARYGHGLSGAIICGTGWTAPLLSRFGQSVSRFISTVKGQKGKSKFIHSLADGAFSKSVKNPRTEFDWISANEDNVDEYMADDLNGFQFSLGGYTSLMRMTELAADLELAKKIPHDLPLLFIAGSDDPVGNNGKGVIEAADLLKKAGAENIKIIIYEGMRHEILNEKESRRVFDDVYIWITDMMKKESKPGNDSLIEISEEGISQGARAESDIAFKRTTTESDPLFSD